MKRKIKLAIVESLANAFDSLHFAHLEMAKENIDTDEILKARDLVEAEVKRLKNLFFHGGTNHV